MQKVRLKIGNCNLFSNSIFQANKCVIQNLVKYKKSFKRSFTVLVYYRLNPGYLKLMNSYPPYSILFTLSAIKFIITKLKAFVTKYSVYKCCSYKISFFYWCSFAITNQISCDLFFYN